MVDGRFGSGNEGLDSMEGGVGEEGLPKEETGRVHPASLSSPADFQTHRPRPFRASGQSIRSSRLVSSVGALEAMA